MTHVERAAARYKAIREEVDELHKLRRELILEQEAVTQRLSELDREWCSAREALLEAAMLKSEDEA